MAQNLLGPVCPVPLTVRVGGGDALRAACRAGDHIEIVKLLVSHGANARHQSVKEDEYDETTGNWRGPQEAAGSTPLYTAACHGRLSVVAFLLETAARADVNRDPGYPSDFRSPFNVAICNGHEDVKPIAGCRWGTARPARTII